MNPPSLPTDIQTAVTEERLRLLSLGFYISGAIGAVLVSFLLIHLAMFAGFSFMPESAWHTGKGHPDAPPVMLFRILAAILGGIILVGWTLGGLTGYAGRCIARRENRTFILIMSAINCIWIPYGTLLGVASFSLLSTPAAKDAFKTGKAPTTL